MTQDGLSERGSANVEPILPVIRKEAEERKKRNIPMIDLAKAENVLIRPEVLEIYKKAIVDNLESSHLSYPKGTFGDPVLHTRLADFFNTYFNPAIPVTPDHLVTAPGASTCLDALMFNICNPGDAVLIPGPYWSAFDFKLRARSLVETIPVNVDNFSETFTPKLIPALEAALQMSARPVRALLMTNPHNPLGQCYPQTVLEECLKFCHAHGIHYISDEVYALSQFPNPHLANPPPFVSALSLDLHALGCDSKLVHTVWSASKDFGSSGIRLGCIVTQANHALAAGSVIAANEQTSSLSAVALSGLLRSPRLPDLLALNAARLADAYRTVTHFLTAHGVEFVPATAGVFVFARLAPGVRTWEEEAEAVARLRGAGVLVGAGRGFRGGEREKGWVRIVFAGDPAELRKGLDVIAFTLFRGQDK